MAENQNDGRQRAQQTIIVRQEQQNINGLGVAGFIIALVSFLTGWIPVLGWILWALGFIFSFIGLFRKPRGMAIAGFIISLLALILIILATSGVIAIFSSLF